MCISNLPLTQPWISCSMPTVSAPLTQILGLVLHSTIDIDVSAYTGGDATFVLVDTDLFGGTYANNGGGFGTIGTITNTAVNSWGGGYDVTYDQSLFDGDDDDGFTGQITLTLTAVPEPSSTALLGLGGLALMLRRKRS